MTNESGGSTLPSETRVVEGVEFRSTWVPISAAEQEAIIAKAGTEQVDVGVLLANFLRAWLRRMN